MLAFSIGILVAALTTKFRDLTFLLTFGIQLLMFMSPVIFPLSMVPKEGRLRTVIELNPMTAVLEGFRAALLGTPMDVTACCPIPPGSLSCCCSLGWSSSNAFNAPSPM